MRGCSSIASVMKRENRLRSTASARPAGTAVASAARSTSEPSRRISSLSSPTALPSEAARSELLHTSSASSGLACAGEKRSGFISCSTTSTPRSASWKAASEPARPAPTTTTRKAPPRRAAS